MARAMSESVSGLKLLTRAERRYIRGVIASHDLTMARVAEHMGIEQSDFYRRMGGITGVPTNWEDVVVQAVKEIDEAAT